MRHLPFSKRLEAFARATRTTTSNGNIIRFIVSNALVVNSQYKNDEIIDLQEVSLLAVDFFVHSSADDTEIMCRDPLIFFSGLPKATSLF